MAFTIVSPGEELDVEEDVLPAVHEAEALGCQQNLAHLGRRGAENDHCKQGRIESHFFEGVNAEISTRPFPCSFIKWLRSNA